MEQILNWIEQWYASNCDGDWEHQYSIRIHTLDNPGWSVNIDLKSTELDNITIEYKLFENSESDWYGFSVKNSVYHAAGDPNKLEFLLFKFKEIAEGNKQT